MSAGWWIFLLGNPGEILRFWASPSWMHASLPVYWSNHKRFKSAYNQFFQFYPVCVWLPFQALSFHWGYPPPIFGLTIKLLGTIWTNFGPYGLNQWLNQSANWEIEGESPGTAHQQGNISDKRNDGTLSLDGGCVNGVVLPRWSGLGETNGIAQQVPEKNSSP